jgi:CHASE2 domain-containing sensor protein/signal transduction histidine kinase
MNLRLRLGIEWLVIGAVASLLVILAYDWRGSQSFDNLFYDQLGALSRPAADRDVLIVAIDDPSLKTLGKWPWPRENHARILEKLQAAGARSITLDVLLSEAGEAQGDSALSVAMARGRPVFIPLHFISPGSDGRAYDSELPVPPFLSAAKGIGHVNLAFDTDGIVRRSALCFDPQENGKKWPHVMELVYRATLGNGKPSAAFAREACGTELMIPYAHRGSYTEISYADLLLGNVPAGIIKDKDIIIGATATGMQDNYPVPYSDGGLLSGAEIMANMLAATKRDNFITPLNDTLTLAMSLLPLWLLLLGFLRWRPRTALTVSLIAVVVILTGSATALIARIWLPPGSALFGIFLVYPLWGWRRLQAMSDFMATELGALSHEGEISPLPIKPSQTTDLVGRQSEALAGAIDHMRDLRRFVADTLADLPDPMFVTDTLGQVTLSNDLLNERLGENIVGMPLAQALDRIVAPEYRAVTDRYLASVVSQNPHDASEYVRFVSPRDRTFVMRRAAVENAKGELRGFIFYLADISALARAEAEREEVLQLLSHDMRAPQSAIIALLDGKIDADARKRIERNARRTMQLAQDFVDLARMGETEFHGEDILLADLIRDVADNFWPLAHERGIHIDVTDKSDSGFVCAEPDSLSRAFANLIDNAIKFGPDNSAITITVDRKGSELTVAICDEGAGIDNAILPLLFTRFASSEKQKGRAKGTGLGLTFVRAVIERHKGSITAQNGALRGCCFLLVLPEAAEA